MLPRALSASISCVWMLPVRLLLLSEAFHCRLVIRVAVSRSPEPQAYYLAPSSSRRGRGKSPRGRARLPRVLSRRGGGGGGIDGGTSDMSAVLLAAVLDKERRLSAVAAVTATSSAAGTAMPSSSSPGPASPTSVLEVEEKFDLSSTPDAASNVERRLRGAGFVRHSVVEMVDWYFDSPAYALCRNDCWLRCRHQQSVAPAGPEAGAPQVQEGKHEREWQLKRGRHVTKSDREGDTEPSSSSSRATVYEETEGIHAVALACSLLVDPVDPRDASRLPPPPVATEFASESTYPIPAIPPIPPSMTDRSSAGDDSSYCPKPPALVPFARIITRRSHWVPREEEEAPRGSDQHPPTDRRFARLVVDLDATDFGHAVGEVEALVVASNDEEDEGRAVTEARQLIHDFLRHVIYRDDDDDDDEGREAEPLGLGDARTVGNSTSGKEKKITRAPAQGKLECYLERFRPELYSDLIDAGVMRRPSDVVTPSVRP